MTDERLADQVHRLELRLERLAYAQAMGEQLFKQIA
jgi:hypothetical protein